MDKPKSWFRDSNLSHAQHTSLLAPSLSSTTPSSPSICQRLRFSHSSWLCTCYKCKYCTLLYCILHRHPVTESRSEYHGKTSSAVAEMGNRLTIINMDWKVGGCCAPFRGGAGTPSNTMWLGPGRGLPAYQVASWSIPPFGRNTPTLQDRQTDRQTHKQWSNSTGRTVLQTVSRKLSLQEMHTPHIKPVHYQYMQGKKTLPWWQ